MYAGLAIYDTMCYVEPRVGTICMGIAASMAAVILAGGAPGMRFSLPNTRVLIHQPSGGFSGQAADIQIHAQEILRVRRRLDEILAHHTGKPIEVINRNSDRDFFMSSEEAKAYGLIDEIIQGRPKGDGPVPKVASNGGGARARPGRRVPRRAAARPRAERPATAFIAPLRAGQARLSRQRGTVTWMTERDDRRRHTRCSFCGKSQEQVQQADRRAGRVHLRRVHRPLPGDHRGGQPPHRAEAGKRRSQIPNPQVIADAAQPVRHRPGARQEGPSVAVYNHYKRVAAAHADRRRRAREEQHPAGRPHRLRQDAAGPDAGQDPRRALLHRRRHRADRGRLRRRGRREHPAAPIQAADFDISRAERGIVYIDEIDKIARKSDNPSHHPRRLAARACSRRC